MDIRVIHGILIRFILLLYAEPSLPRKIVDTVINSMHDVLKNYFFPSMENDILQLINTTTDKEKLTTLIKQCFVNHSNIFNKFTKETDRFKLLESKGFEHPLEFEIEKTYKEKLSISDSQNFVTTSFKGVYIPLRKSLKLFLEIPQMFENIKAYMQALLNENFITFNIIQGRFWLKNFARNLKNELILPLYIYYDEIEVGNALGSHAGVNKFGVVYAIIACLPPNIASRLSSIIFSTIIRAKDIKKCVLKI